MTTVATQEDLSRPDGLPSKIGGPTCNNSAGRPVASITGFLNVSGMSNTGTTPTFSVAVYAGGMFVARRRLKSGGAFAFYCVPRENVSLIGEVDSVEVSTVSMGILAFSTNRQDVNISWSEPGASKQRTGVVSARNAYERSKENQKLFDKALDDLESKNNNSAAKVLKKLLENDTNDWVSWTLLGNVHFNSDRFNDAEVAYNRSIALKKDYVPALIGLGRSSLNLMKFDRAIEMLSAAYEAEPDSADVNHYLGEAYLQVRKGSLGIMHLNKAIGMAPDAKAELHLRIAALYIKAGAKNLAANEYKLFLQKRPSYSDRQRMEKFISENSM